jgi:drug/metabolite transporter (DMT)-like permease
MRNTSLLGHLLALATILIWGTTLVSTKTLLAVLSPSEIIVYRFVLAYGLLLLVCRDALGWRGWAEERLFIGLGLSGITLYFWAENAALQYTLSANVGLIVSSIPIMTAMLAHFLTPDEKFSKRLLLGFLVAMSGIALIIYNGRLLRLNPLGDVLALACSLSFTWYSVLARKVSAELGKLVVVRKTFFWGLLFALPVWLLWESPSLQHLAALDHIAWANLLYLAVFASVLGYGMWNKAVALIGAVRTANYIYLMPLITMLAAVLVLGERLTVLMLAGGTLVVAGVYVNESRR